MAGVIPPSWKDLGKATNDLLGKDYPIQGTTLEVKTRAPNGVVFRTLGVRDNKTDHIQGEVEIKYENKKNGTIVTNAWTTANVIKNQVELTDHVTKGLKFEAISSLLPETQQKNVVLASIYKQPNLHTRTNIDVFKGPLFTADSVIGRDGYLLGLEATYDNRKASVARVNAAVGYHAPEYAVTLHALNHGKLYTASYYQRVNNDIEVAARAIHDSSKSAKDVKIELGTKTYLDNAAFVKAKVNNDNILALGYTQALRPGVKVSAGLALDLVKLQSGEGPAHKIGASFNFES